MPMHPGMLMDTPIPIGSNQEEGDNAFTISTDEKRNVVKKTFSLPPSRNESFIWLIRTYFQQEKLDQRIGTD